MTGGGAGRPDEARHQRDDVLRERDGLLRERDELMKHRDELLRRNAELEETNRGVTARYTQLSEELEETNRGVVALYAELDERSAQAHEASRAKSRFLANVSHELRAPVAAIMGLVRLLADPGSDPLTPEQRQQVDLLAASAGELLALVNELLDLAKAESGRLEPHWAEVSLPALFGQLRGTVRALLTQPDVTLRVDGPVGIPVLITDESMLTQVLRNLLTNAVKFTARGEVRLTAVPGEEPGTVRLAVSDTGIGIASADVERVFEEFYQVPGVRQATMRGTGLGLPYARRLVGLLGGSLTLRSEPGQGSVFTVTLPVRPAGATPGAAPGRARPAEGGTGTTGLPAGPRSVPAAVLRRVLVADDDEAFRLFAGQALRAVAEEVEEAGDGLHALTLITRRRPDVVLLDVRMPEVDGPAVLEVLAADEGLCDIPVVVVTAEPPDEAPGSSAAAPGGSMAGALAHAAAVLDKAGLTPQALAEAVRAAAGVAGGAAATEGGAP
ncbi:ATP-binding protein [Planosporangium sp. 12N6]|uniref:ATP-binding response regulator n=1 Tax=Planosporangium spinosum TaxID=3402278 RepID=UPI003CF3165A